HGEQVDHRGPALQLVSSGFHHRPDDGYLEAPHLRDADRDLRVRYVFAEPPTQLVPQLHGGQAGRLHVVEQRQRDPAVRANGRRPAHRVVPPHRYLEHVFGPDAVTGQVRSRRLNARTRVRGGFAALRDRPHREGQHHGNQHGSSCLFPRTGGGEGDGGPPTG